MAKPWFKKTDPLMPPYPYGKNNHFPEANYGLYGGTTIMSGNKISKGRNEGKTVRKWFPNIKFETIRSEALDRDLHIPIRARVLRTIRKCGGLDEYLLGDKPSRIKELGLLGWKLRWMVMNSPSMQKRFAAEREKYGVGEADPVKETFEQVWNDDTKRQQLLDQQDEAWEKLRAKLQRYDQHIQAQFESADHPRFTYADRIRMLSGTLVDRKPSTLGLPQKIKELAIGQAKDQKADQAEV